jgi:signal transduction histidine kinase
LARVKSGQPLGEIGDVDLAAVVSEVAESYREQAEGKKLAMGVSLPAEAVVRIDRQALQLVVSNLVSNAVKYTAAGRVDVRLTAEDGWAMLAVADTGMGIPAGDVPKLFREFFRASNARKSKISGTGVGLAGIKSIVERFDGRLAVDSIEGAGSTFTVRLPLAGDSSTGVYVSAANPVD